MIMPRPRLATFAIFTSLAFAACAKGSSDTASPTPTDNLRWHATDGAETTKGDTAKRAGDIDGRFREPADDAGRKVIRTGQISIVVASYDDTRVKLDAILMAAGGYVDSTQVTHRQGAVSDATIVLRLPSKTFGSIVPKLRELGEIVSETTNAADITDQYVDIAARLASSKTLEKRLLELAAERNGTVDSVLAVERELARVRGEIESYEGRIRQWNDQVAMSTLTLAISTKTPEIAAAAPTSLGDRISHGFSSSLKSLRDLGAWIAVNGIAFLPWLVLLIPGFVIGRRLWRRVAKHLLPRAIARPAQPTTTEISPPVA